MDGLSAAASVLAVIEVSMKVASLCSHYSTAVKEAKNDIQRLQRKIEDIRDVLQELKWLLEGPNKPRLSATDKLAASLTEYLEWLQELETQLKPRKTHKAMSRLGLRALTWPFKSKEVEKIVARLEEYERTFSLSLQIDQTYLLISISLCLTNILIDTQVPHIGPGSKVRFSQVAGCRRSLLRLPFGGAQ